MTTISIIGAGNMATAIGTRAAKHGHTIELMSRDAAKAQALADRIGNGAAVGTYGARPAGDIVIVAVLYQNAVDVVASYGDALAGKILVDITNPFNADGTGLVTTAGDSVSERIAAAPEGTQVTKAVNTIFGHVLAGTRPWTRSSPVTAPRRRHVSRHSWRAWACGPWTQEGSRWPMPSNGPASSWWAWHATGPASTLPWALRSADRGTPGLRGQAGGRRRARRGWSSPRRGNRTCPARTPSTPPWPPSSPTTGGSTWQPLARPGRYARVHPTRRTQVTMGKHHDPHCEWDWRCLAASDHGDQEMVALSTVSTWLELKFEKRTVITRPFWLTTRLAVRFPE